MNVRGEIYLAATNGESRVVQIESPRFTIGRGAENSLCIPATVVSRSHAELIRVGTDYLLRDLGSTNGSFVNGVRVTEQMLNDGDTLRFGSNGPEMAFRLIEADSGAVPAHPRHEQSTAESLIHSLTGQLRNPQADVSEEANLRRVLAETHLNKGDFDQALEVMARYNILASFSNAALMDTIARVGRDPVRKLQADDRLVGPAKLAYRYGIEPTYLIQGCAAALSFAEPGDPQAAELQKLTKERSAEYSLDFISQLRPWNPISKLVRDVLREPK